MNVSIGINEVLFMEMRLFRQFRERFGQSASKTNELWNAYGIWNYIEDCYNTLHVSGDEYILSDITEILRSKGAFI